MRPVKGAPNRVQRLSRFPATPHVSPLFHIFPLRHRNHLRRKIYIRWCCIDLLNAPPLPDIKWILLPRRVRLRDDVPVLLLVLWKILMPLASWFSRAYVPMWLHSRVTRIARVRRARLIRLARLATVGIFRIASLRPNGHREILQFFPNQTQFVDDLFSYLVFHYGPLHILHSPGRRIYRNN